MENNWKQENEKKVKEVDKAIQEAENSFVGQKRQATKEFCKELVNYGNSIKELDSIFIEERKR